MFFRKKGAPEMNEVVLCTVKRLLPHCAFVSLDEYENVEAMLHISEVSTKWVKSIRDFLTENKVIVCKVLAKERNEIDVSLKRVSAGEKQRKMNEIKNELRMEKLIEFMGKKLNEDPKSVLTKIGGKIVVEYGSLYDFYETVRESGVEIIDKLGLPQSWQDGLKLQISEQLKAQRVALQKTIEACSYSSDGIESLKKVFVALKELGKDAEISIKYISAPKYSIELKGDNYKILESIMKKIIARLNEFADKHEIEFKELPA